MYENLTNFEIDEFWNDCINAPNISSINNKSLQDSYSSINYNNKYTKNPILNKNFFKTKKKLPFKSRQINGLDVNWSGTDYLKSKLISTSQSYQSNRKIIQDALIKEESIPLKKYKKEKILI